MTQNILGWFEFFKATGVETIYNPQFIKMLMFCQQMTEYLWLALVVKGDYGDKIKIMYKDDTYHNVKLVTAIIVIYIYYFDIL